jgi:hypothetical protein
MTMMMMTTMMMTTGKKPHSPLNLSQYFKEQITVVDK